jgi:hypothetical protein
VRASKSLCGIATIVRVHGHPSHWTVGGDDAPSRAHNQPSSTPPFFPFSFASMR